MLNKFKSKSLIIDRVKIENQKDINKLKSTFSKIVCLDSENRELKNCLRINSLIHNKNVKYSGYKYLITPLVNNIKSQVPIKKNKIFISLGGVKRKIKIFNILKILNKIEGLKVSIPEFVTRNNNNNLKYDNN